MGLTEMMAALRRTVQGIGDQAAQLNTEVEELARQRDAIRYAPATKADIKAAIGQWLDARAAGYEAGLRESLLPFIRQPAQLQGPQFAQAFRVLSAGQPYGSDLPTGELDRVFSFLFKDQLKATLTRTIDAMEWPDAGLPADQRAAALQELDSRIDAKRAQLDLLRRQLVETGVSI